MSVLEVMGDESIIELRKHAAGLIAAVTGASRLRRDVPAARDDLDAIEFAIDEHVRRILVGLADRFGAPREGESLSRGADAPRHGDYRIMASGCHVWMRTLDTRGYPVLGRRTKHRHIRPAILYWMLAYGPLPEDMRLERTCGERLCVNPQHGEVISRSEHGARVMRSRSVLDWDAVHEIRSAVPDGTNPYDLAERFGVGVHTIMDVFRGKTWSDPSYVPGVDRACAGCRAPFRTTNLIRRYCSADCLRSAIAERQRQRRTDHEPTERELRDDHRLRQALASARAEYEPLIDKEIKSTWGVSLDATLGETRATLHDILADVASENPVTAVEGQYARDVLDGLEEDQIAGLTDDELLDLRGRLVDAGLTPSTSDAFPATD
jgi:hypothetical protein